MCKKILFPLILFSSVLGADTYSDAQINEAVRAALVAKPSISEDAKNINIVTQDGVVTLTGTVDSRDEKNFVVSEVKGVHDVQKVIDRLDIKK